MTRKRKVPEPAPVKQDDNNPFKRVTRSMAASATDPPPLLSLPPPTRAKKPKTETGQGSTAAELEITAAEPDKDMGKNAAVAEGSGDGSASEKGKAVAVAEAEEEEEGAEPEKTDDVTEPAVMDKGKAVITAEEGDPAGLTTVIIEHCNKGKKFKEVGAEMKDYIEETLPDVTVVVNPEPPRKNCFEVRMADGEIIISLLDLKRPFAALTELNMNDVAEAIVARL